MTILIKHKSLNGNIFKTRMSFCEDAKDVLGKAKHDFNLEITEVNIKTKNCSINTDTILPLFGLTEEKLSNKKFI